MIELYSGTPGSGKSLHVADLIYRWVHLFRSPVICNFGFNFKACHERGFGSGLIVDNSKIRPDFLIDFSEQYRILRNWKSVPEETILLVIDEAQILFNAREWQKGNRAEWISFFTQHRKLGYRVVLIAQFDRMLDRQIRSVIEYEHIHRKVKNIGRGGFIFNLVAGGNLHVCVKKYKPLDEKVSSYWFKGNRFLFSLYNSYTRFSADSDVLPAGSGVGGTRKRPAGQKN